MQKLVMLIHHVFIDVDTKMKLNKGSMRASLINSLLIIMTCSVYFIFVSDQGMVHDEPIQIAQDKFSTKVEEQRELKNAPSTKANNLQSEFDFADLNLTLLAAIVANPINQSSAVIQDNSLVSLYKLNDQVKNTKLSIAAIYHNHIVLVAGNQEYELRLSAKPNTDFLTEPRQETASTSEKTALNSEIAKKIGNRPKQLEHIVAITPATEGFYVSPGINPALFRAAKFKEGDVLQSINGKDINEPDELEQAKALILTAETLEFNVLRGGKLVTLYLDIPAQDLSISR